MKEITRYSIILLVVTCLAGAGLGGVRLLTYEKEKMLEEENIAEARQEVLPGAVEFKRELSDKKDVFSGYDSQGYILGWVFTAEGKGYSSDIKTIAGLSLEGKITGIKIVEQKETPGLGAKVEEIAGGETLLGFIKRILGAKPENVQKEEKPYFQKQFAGKKIEDLKVVKGKTDKYIEGITGATITSKAVTDSVRNKAKKVLDILQSE
jgi:electron transport complex protein RnfG